MKKLISLFLVLAILIIPTISDAVNINNISSEISTTKNLYEGLKSNKMSMDKSDFDQYSNLHVDKILNINDTIRFSGNIDGDEIIIEGELYRSELKEKEIIVDAKSVDKNFEIIFMSIVLDGHNRDDFIMNHIDKQNVLKLYLKKENQFYAFEFIIDNYFDEKDIKPLSDENYQIEHWWTNVFEPTVLDIHPNAQYQSNYGNVVDTVKRYIYRETNYEYIIKLRAEISTRDLLNGYTSGSVILFIENQETFYRGELESNRPILGVASSNIIVNVDSNNYDKFIEMSWQTNTSYGNNLFNIEIGYGIGPFNIIYNQNRYAAEGWLGIPESSTHVIKSVKSNNRTPIKSILDSHQLGYQIRQDRYYPGRHYITANIDYAIFFVNHHGIFSYDNLTLRGGYN